MELNIITVLIVPQTLLREGIASLLSDTPYKPVVSVAYCHKFVTHAAVADATILFIVSRDALTECDDDVSLSELHVLRRHHPESRVLVLSDTFNLTDAIAALCAGANGYLTNTLTSDALVKSLDLIVLGETVLASQFAQAVKGEDPDLQWSHPERTVPHQLSTKETAILSHLIQGDSNKHIARGMGVAEATVKTHVKAILRKIRVKNRTQAAMWARNHLPALPRADPYTGSANGVAHHAVKTDA